MKTKLVLLSALFLTAISAQAAGTPTLKDWHKNLACTSCHQMDASTPPSTESCLTCHESIDAVAKRTAYLNERGINPHDNYHYGKNADCLMCHREHRASYDACNECHDFRRWAKPTP